MKTLNRNNVVHIDAKGITRTIPSIRLYSSMSDESDYLDYTNPSDYRMWLRELLDAQQATMKDVRKSITKHIAILPESNIFKSFFTIQQSLGGWDAMLIVAYSTDDKRGYHVSEVFDTCLEAISFINQYSNHDFEIISDESHDLYEMTPSNLVIASLKHS